MIRNLQDIHITFRNKETKEVFVVDLMTMLLGSGRSCKKWEELITSDVVDEKYEVITT